MNIETINGVEAIRKLLNEAQLPSADISGSPVQQFYGICQSDELIAVVGLEPLGNIGLLRSLAVARDQRGRSLAMALTLHVEQQAAAQGIDTLYLLTTTAAEFFRKRGYATCAREDAPAAIRASSQFSALCPSSAVLLSKQLYR